MMDIFIHSNGGSSAAEGFATDIRTHPFVNENKKTTNQRRLKVYCCTESSGLPMVSLMILVMIWFMRSN